MLLIILSKSATSSKIEATFVFLFQVRTPRTEMQRYGGELSGIRAGVRHSIKLQ